MRPDLWEKKTGKRRGFRATKREGEGLGQCADSRRRTNTCRERRKRSHDPGTTKKRRHFHTHASMPLANALSASRADLDSLAPDVVQRYDAGDEDVAFDVLFW